MISYNSLRLFQRTLCQIAEDLASGNLIKNKTIADVTPGAGKTIGLAVFAYRLLKAGYINRIAVYVPRAVLRDQVARVLSNPYLFGEYSVRVADNTPSFVRNEAQSECVGFISTYQALAAAPDMHLEAIDDGNKWLVVFDEGSHLSEAEFKAWGQSAKPLMDKSKHYLIMSGTIERHDSRSIPGVTYAKSQRDGKLYPETDIVYQRRDALAEGAIVPLTFNLIGGSASFDRNGVHVDTVVSDASMDAKDVRDTIYTILSQSTGYCNQIVSKAVDHWKSNRINGSRMLIACGEQQRAREIADSLIKQGIKSVLAISDDGDSAIQVIKDFRDHKIGDILVSVAMAHEGLDVPDIKHVVVLSDIRSYQWIKQLVDRGTRTIPGIKWSDQQCHVFAPDDPFMQAIVARLEHDELTGMEDATQPDRFAGSDRTGSSTKEHVVPLNANADGLRSIAVCEMDVDHEFIEFMSENRDIAAEEIDLRSNLRALLAERDRIVGANRPVSAGHIRNIFGVDINSMGTKELHAAIDYLTSSVS